MKPTIFNDGVAKAIKTWHHNAKKHVKRSKHSPSNPGTPMSSRPGTPSHGTSPVHLLRYYKSEMDTPQTSPQNSNFNVDHWDNAGSPSPTHHNRIDPGSSTYHHHIELGHVEGDAELHHEPSSSQVAPVEKMPHEQDHEIEIDETKEDRGEFSFVKRQN
ncbi:hypothetical protein ABTG41_15430 [Acinetobacter baumannii]